MSNKLRILHITNAFPVAGYEAFGIFIKEQIESLKDEVDFEVIFINAAERGILEYLKVIKRIRHVSKNYDIIHCHHCYSALPYILSFVKKPFLMSVLGDMRKMNFFNRMLFYFVAFFAAKIVYKYDHEYKNEKFFHLPNGVDLDKFFPIKKKDAKERLSLVPEKNYALFVSANGLENKIKRHDEFIRILKILEKNNIKLYPLYLTKISRDLVPYYYCSSELLLVTSAHEGSPNSVKEAMACNLAVVSTNVGNVARILNNCEGSFIIREHTTEAELVSGIKKCLGVTTNGRETLLQFELDMESVARKLFSLYQNIYRKSYLGGVNGISST